MDGFGAADTWTPNALTPAQVTAFFDPVNGIGLSLLRIGIDVNGTPLGTGVYSDAMGAHSFGAKVWAAPWSPPPADKSNDSLDNGGTLNTDDYQSWATILAGFGNTFQQATGFPLYAISAQNEPDWPAASYASCVYSGPEMVSFVKVLAPMLAALNPPVKLMVGESANWSHFWGGVSGTGMPLGYGSAVLADPVASKTVSILATHDYGLPNPNIPTRPAPPSGVRQPIWQTEMADLGPEDLDIASGINVAIWVYAAITTGGASAWHYWWLVNINTDGEGLLQSDGDLTNPPKRLYTLGNFSKFVRPGYVRIESTGTLPSTVWVVAFQNPADSTLALVAINSDTSAVPLSVAVSGSPAPSKVTPWVTSADDNLAAQTAISVSRGTFATTLAAQSVTTFVGTP
jgi:glucuronoarabinoxylan endo-1,4-beta-xylanase